MNKFTLSAANDDIFWDTLVEMSPQGTIFSKSRYLAAVGVRTERFVVLKGAEPKAAVALVLSDDGKDIVLDELVIYNGIMFIGANEKKDSKARFERFELTEYVIDELTGRYRRVELALASQFEDMRPFLWHNYHSSNEHDKFDLDLRYTSYLDISELSQTRHCEETSLFAGMETLRQRNMREAVRDGAITEPGVQTDSLIEFYRELMSTQGDPASSEKLARMKHLVEHLIREGLAEMFLTRNRTGDLLYATVFCFDSKRAYYLFGAGAPSAVERYRGTYSFWGAFDMLAKRHAITCVDMEGVNSPKRGWFKLSFGGNLMPYYQVYYRRT
jgi:hypothetical protein